MVKPVSTQRSTDGGRRVRGAPSVNSFRQYRRLLGYLLNYRGRFIWTVLASLPGSALQGATAFLSGTLVDQGLQAGRADWLLWIPVALVLAAVLQGIFEYISQYQASYLGNAIIRDLRLQLYDRLSRMTLDYYQRASTGTFISRYFQDPAVLQVAVVTHLKEVVIQASKLLLLFGVLVYRNPLYACLSVTVVVLLAWPVRRLSQRIQQLDHQLQNTTSHLLDVFSNNVRCMKVIKLFTLQPLFLQRFRHALSEGFTTSMGIATALILIRPLIHLVAAIGLSVVLIAGGWAVQSGQMTPGDLVSFLLALAMAYEPMKELASQWSAIHRTMAPAQRVFEKVDVRPAFDENATSGEIAGPLENLVLENVSFAYDADRPVLRHIHLTLSQGEVLAIVGGSGGGKSTLADLMARFMDPTEGRILYNGIDLRNYQTLSLRQQMALVSQDTTIFDGTLAENIRLGRLDATDEAVEEAAKQAVLYDWIMAQPQGFETPVGENGVKLSGGQRQRVAIARAFLKNAPLLILDEATSALDNTTEARLQQTLRRLMTGRTVVMIAHRLSTVRMASRIIVLEAGCIVESGTHEALMALEGRYHQLQQV
ncbi:MAG: ABC transporter ATP-binding protein [Candidatus Melainabacteria bacterium]|nr:ABC transporter ATP-binding protein [Candidatus Melainabacteria bacterium]